MPPGYMEAPANVNYENEGQWRRRPAKMVVGGRSACEAQQADDYSFFR
ncbi:hypothetical protein [Enterobacter hormaechei]|nr:hypothetical protein [Enterobacter hormaechei]